IDLRAGPSDSVRQLRPERFYSGRQHEFSDWSRRGQYAISARHHGEVGSRQYFFQNDEGSVALWQLRDPNIVGGGAVGTNPGPSWHIKSTGDFNADGSA